MDIEVRDPEIGVCGGDRDDLGCGVGVVEGGEEGGEVVGELVVPEVYRRVVDHGMGYGAVGCQGEGTVAWGCCSGSESWCW